jgi:hypothetical protein
MPDHQISLPDDIYQGLLAAAHAEGVTPADWIATQLPKAANAPEDFDPAAVEHLFSAFDSRNTKLSVCPPDPSGQSPEFRVLGRDKGLYTVPEDFNDPLPEDIQEAFEGRLP